jgi:N-acetylmuramoyl-L-alanine amidase
MKRVTIFTFFTVLLTHSLVVSALEFKHYPIQSEERSKLMAEYNKMHYGYDSDKLIDPKMIVIHYTVIPNLEDTLRVFKPAQMNSNRPYILKNGKVNVGVQFVVDKNGDIYSLLPENATARHAIGYNHISFGVENIAKDAEDLTPAQLDANIKLVDYLVKKYPTIKYLVGHHEYVNKSLPHYKLYKELDANYKPTVKSDPGDKFMSELRTELKTEYKIILEK